VLPASSPLSDPEGIITYVNPAFEKVYGYRSEEVLGRTPRILKSGEIPSETTEHLWSELLAGRPFRGEYRNRSRSGELVDVVSLASPILDDQGEVRGFVAIQQDVTREKIAEAERRTMDIKLAQLEKMEALGTLAGRMAHDFNNILSIVLSHADLIARIETQSSRTDRAVETIRKAVQRGASVAGQVLNFARVSEVQRGRIDIADLILELSSMLSESLPETVHLTVDLDPDLPEIEGDSGQLHQAILNLCMNARDAMPGGGDVKIEARPIVLGSGTIAGAAAGEYLLVGVSDNGSGIEGDTLERIFDPFFSTKDKSKGTGLGLAIVYGIVTAHGGVIEVDSTIGKGTAFRIYIPVRDEVDGSGMSLPSDAACEA
jgi:PAS domain S-box-containing protein